MKVCRIKLKLKFDFKTIRNVIHSPTPDTTNKLKLKLNSAVTSVTSS